MSGDSAFERVEFGAGSIIFKEGDDADDAYLIEGGTVEIAMRSKHERRIVVNELGRGDLFGEMALISGGKRMASAVAVSNVNVIVVSRTLFEEKLTTMDPVMARVLKTLTRKLTLMSQRHVEELAKIR
ncbi:MAG: cyclic nucleotide-binding domain-containing protein [Alphaproteobacteria bacterium]